MNNKEKIELLNIRINNCNLYLDRLPKKLYKYRPFDNYTFDMLENNYIYLCPAKNLDDETECNMNFDLKMYYDLETNMVTKQIVDIILDYIKPNIIEENYLKIKEIVYSTIDNNGKLHFNKLFENICELQKLSNNEFAPILNYLANIPEVMNQEKIKNKFNQFISGAYLAKEKFGICSLAESGENEYMWKNYANNDTGYCIEYNLENYENLKDLLPVVYDDVRENNVIVQVMKTFISQMIMNLSNNEVVSDRTHYLRLYLTKNTIWQYQKEWRIIGEANEKLKSPKVSKIILGKNVSKENEEKIRKYVVDKNIIIEKN